MVALSHSGRSVQAAIAREENRRGSEHAVVHGPYLCGKTSPTGDEIPGKLPISAQPRRPSVKPSVGANHTWIDSNCLVLAGKSQKSSVPHGACFYNAALPWCVRFCSGHIAQFPPNRPPTGAHSTAPEPGFSPSHPTLESPPYGWNARAMVLLLSIVPLVDAARDDVHSGVAG